MEPSLVPFLFSGEGGCLCFKSYFSVSLLCKREYKKHKMGLQIISRKYTKCNDI